MKIAIVTPYHDPDSPYLTQCVDSVRNQTYADFLHIMIGDGCNLHTAQSHAKLHNIALPHRLNNYGDSPRSIGVVYAFSIGADAVMFLDSDNWYAPTHLETMVRVCKATQSDVVTSRRYLSHLNGSVLGICPESDGIIFCDTNCFMITKKLAEEAAAWWLIPDDMHVIDDRFMWDILIHATDKISSTNTATVFYRTAFAFHYHMFNTTPPQGTKPGTEIGVLGETINTLQQRARQRTRAIKRDTDQNQG